MRNRLVLHPCVVVENREGYLCGYGPPQEQAVPTHTEFSSPDHQCWKEKFTQHLAMKIRNSVPIRQRAAVNPDNPVK